MPNHYTTVLTIKGPENALDAFLATHVVRPERQEGDGGEPEPQFDFNTVIPMPEILRGSESSSTVDYGLAVLGLAVPRRFSLGVTLKAMLDYPWAKAAGITTEAAMKEHLLKLHPDCVEKGQKAYDAYKACGHADWYSWSCAHWGTKWNAYHLEATRPSKKRLVLRFDTAWSPPMPIFNKLIERYPDLEFTARGKDEFDNNYEVLLEAA